MSATLRWIVERRLLTLAGFGVILLGAFIPWPSLAVAAVVIVVGSLLLAVQIPIAMRDATEQLDGVDEPDEQWQAPAYPQYQPEPYQPSVAPLQPELSHQAAELAPVWQPLNIPRAEQPAAFPEPAVPSESPAPSRQMYEPAPVWQPQNIPQSPAPAPAAEPRPSRQPEPSRPMYEPVPVWQPAQMQPPDQPDLSPQAEPPRRLDETSLPWRPKNIPQYRPEP